jgi:hypothetical protein
MNARYGHHEATAPVMFLPDGADVGCFWECYSRETIRIVSFLDGTVTVDLSNRWIESSEQPLTFADGIAV